MEKAKEKIVNLVEGVLTQEDCELAELTVSRYKNRSTVRLFVYSEGGVSIDRCAHLSRVIGDVLDGTDLFNQNYTLEVSSPGLDRPLTTVRDFKYRAGETVKVMFADDSRKKVTAEIVSVEGDAVRFRDDNGEFQVKVDEIETAKIVF